MQESALALMEETAGPSLLRWGKLSRFGGSDRVILLESSSYVRCKIHEIVAIDDPSYVV